MAFPSQHKFTRREGSGSHRVLGALKKSFGKVNGDKEN